VLCVACPSTLRRAASPRRPHSARNATTGSTRDARRAGK
jgi:hypothetical protein